MTTKLAIRGKSKRKIGNACQLLQNVEQCEPY